MKITRAALALSLLVSIALATGRVAGAEDPILIRFSHVVSEKAPKGFGAELFKKLVEEQLAGKVVVEIYPRAEKFNDEDVLLAMMFGDVELAAPSFVQLHGYAPAFQVYDLPFLFKDIEHIHRFQQSVVGQQLQQMALPYGLQGLAYWDAGMRVISAVRPIRVPTDVEGLRFRLEPSDVFHEQYQRIGVIGIPMPFRRLVDAIRDGLVEGQENAWSNIYTRGINKLHRNYVELNHSFLGYLVVANADFWQGLPNDIRTVLEKILQEVTAQVNQRALEEAIVYRDKAIAEGGIQVVSPTAAEFEQWRQAWLPVWSQFEEGIGKAVVDAAVAAGGDS